MKKAICFLLSLLFTVPVFAETAWQKSPELEALITQLKERYATTKRDSDHERMNEVNNLSYFIRFNDQPDTLEYKLLKAYLLGLQNAHVGSINQQIKTNVIPWFCPKGKLRKRSSNNNPTQLIENIIWLGLEQSIKLDPRHYTSYGGAASFATVEGTAMYGFQTKYPCYETMPHSHRLVGKNY